MPNMFQTCHHTFIHLVHGLCRICLGCTNANKHTGLEKAMCSIRHISGCIIGAEPLANDAFTNLLPNIMKLVMIPSGKLT